MTGQRYTREELEEFPVGTLVTVFTAGGPYMALRADEGEHGPGAASTDMAQVASGKFWIRMADWGPIQILHDPRVNDLDEMIRLQRVVLELDEELTEMAARSPFGETALIRSLRGILRG